MRGTEFAVDLLEEGPEVCRVWSQLSQGQVDPGEGLGQLNQLLNIVESDELHLTAGNKL